MTIKDAQVNFSDLEEKPAKIEFAEETLDVEIKSPMLGTLAASGTIGRLSS